MALEREGGPRRPMRDDSHELQRELLKELHDDGRRELEATLVRLLDEREHRSTGDHRLRRSIDSLLPFIIGLIIGVLATYGAFSGRISTLEAVTTQHGAAIAEQRADFNAYVKQTADALARINDKLPTPRGER